MSSAQNAPSIRYRYDALDRLTGHCQLNDPERLRFYCENRLATEIEGGEQLSIVQHGDQLLAQQQHQNGGVNSTLLATDLQRSVLNALQSNSTRAIAYSVYGHRPSISGLISLLGFNGQHPDPVTGHYLLGNGYRGFNPVLMRFNSSDGLSPFGKGGLNGYMYCEGDPANRSDPTGHFFSSIAKLFSRRLPRYVYDDETGVIGKSAKSVTRISEGILVIQDKYNKGSRLTFWGHGSADDNLVGRGDGQNLDALQLLNLAESRGVPARKFDSYRLVVCHSADRGVNGISFAEEFHQIVGRPVKGFEGVVKIPRSFKKPDLAVGKTYKRPYYFGVVKRPLTGEVEYPNYRPVTFGGTKKENSEIRRKR